MLSTVYKGHCGEHITQTSNNENYFVNYKVLCSLKVVQNCQV